ncbi:Uncharacterised protein [Serratia quinivorans]|uniref:Uncharacterized protein n=1 Tax=Serratia quinivorans TaxID=137545 RepID=A0A380AHB7_9GAMM|nr:hypothetical protein [Serratia proteamaculans]SUI81067.1 Uncharacterised protein [Serratia quinivorans]
MSDIKFDRRADHLYRLTGEDVINYKRGKSTKGETIFYSTIFIIGILALGVVWG